MVNMEKQKERGKGARIRDGIAAAHNELARTRRLQRTFLSSRFSRRGLILRVSTLPWPPSHAHMPSSKEAFPLSYMYVCVMCCGEVCVCVCVCVCVHVCFVLAKDGYAERCVVYIYLVLLLCIAH